MLTTKAVFLVEVGWSVSGAEKSSSGNLTGPIYDGQRIVCHYEKIFRHLCYVILEDEEEGSLGSGLTKILP